jgi:hypothetical protein
MMRTLSVFFLMIAVALTAAAQSTKKEKEPTERSVSGVVSNAAGKAIPGAVVQLKNSKTLEVRSFIAKQDGQYYFHGLSTDVDYELKASSDGKWSSTKNLSSFNTHLEANVDLQVK